MTPPPDPNPTAPVEEKCATCGREEVWHRGSMHGFRKPAPAPEPKQGSVDNSVFTASQAAYLSMEREREALRAEVERLRRLILQAGARENGLKADLQLATEELAAAKEERDKFEAESEQKGADLMAAEGILAEASEDADLAALTPEMLRIQIIQLRDLVTMEQASLAAAREEIGRLIRIKEESRG